jgi:xanthosine utilization system XapX-like protein
MSKDEEKFEHTLEEREETHIAIRRSAPLIGLVAFLVALIGSKIFTFFNPGTSMIFHFLGEEIHFHHFNYGLIMLLIGVFNMFFEGPWHQKFGHFLFGAGLGLIVDEYWILLTFNDTQYFVQESYLISIVIGVVISIIYAVIVIARYNIAEETSFWQRIKEKFGLKKKKD